MSTPTSAPPTPALGRSRRSAASAMRRWSSGVVLCGAVMLPVGSLGGPPPGTGAGEELRHAPGDELRIVTVDASAFPEVVATVALPPSARELPDASANLSVTSAGVAVPAEVERLAADQQPVAILIDTAAGTSQAELVAQQGAAVELVRLADPANPIVVGSSTNGLVFGPDTDRGAALEALGALDLGGSRDWPRTLDEALGAVDESPRATVVVVSTGRTSEPSAGPTGLAARLGDGGLRVRWISLGSDADPVGELEGIQSVMPATTDGLLVRMDAVVAELVTQYRLVFRVDPRAVSAAITLVADRSTWTAETPIPLPSPAYIDQTPAPTVQSATASAPAPADLGTSSALQGIQDFLNQHRILVTIVALALLILAAAASLRAAPD